MPTDNDDGLDPELEDALNSVDNGDDEPYFNASDAPDEEEPASVEAAAPVAPAPKNKGGRPRKNAAKHVAAEPIAPQATPRREAPPERDMKAIWEDCIERARDRGFGGPENISISVVKHIIGPNREATVSLNTISGENVAGSSFRTAGEDLQDYLERAYHVPSGSGPAMYRLRFTLRGAPKNDRFLGSAEVVLQSAADIRRQWEAAASLKRERERDQDYSPLRADPRAAFGAVPTRGVSPYEIGPTTAADHPTIVPSAPVLGGGNTDMTMMFMKYLMDQNERERREAIRRGEQPPTMQLPPEIARLVGGAPQAAVAPAAPQGSLEERVARTVVETLRAMGITPQAAQTVAGVPVPPSPPSLTGPVVQTAVTAPMNAAKEFFTQMREFKKMEADMREMFAPEEEEAAPVVASPTVLAQPEEDENALKPVNETFVRFEGDPVMFGKQAEGETNFQWLMRLGTGNPKIVGKVLEKGMQVLDSGTLGKLIAALAPQGGPPQGTAPRGLPNGASAPQAQQPQSNGTAGGWTPNVG